MSLKDQLDAIVLAVLEEDKLDGAAEAAENLSAVTKACEDRAHQGLRSLAFPEPTDKAAFLSKGAAYKLQELLVAEGLQVRVIPYKDVYFYLDMNW